MTRKKLIRQNSFPYHVTMRTNNKDWFQIPMCDVWDICKQSLKYAIAKNSVVIHSFVLMGNHYHLLLTTPNEDIDKFMQSFNLNLSRLITKKSGVINHKFSNRYKWTIVAEQNYLLNVYRYIYQNPVRAGIAVNCFSYPYSSLHFTSYESKLFNHYTHIDYAQEKLWLERNYGDDFNQIIKNALTKETFKKTTRVSKYFQTALQNPRI